MKGTYVATLELDPRSGQWMADIEGEPVHTWGRTLAKVKEYAHEALASHLGVSVEDVRGRLAFRTPVFPDPVVAALAMAEAARSVADDAAARAAQAKAAAAHALVQDVHLSMRDAAEILGISHQRVQQLVSGPRPETSEPDLALLTPVGLRPAKRKAKSATRS